MIQGGWLAKGGVQVGNMKTGIAEAGQAEKAEINWKGSEGAPCTETLDFNKWSSKRGVQGDRLADGRGAGKIDRRRSCCFNAGSWNVWQTAEYPFYKKRKHTSLKREARKLMGKRGGLMLCFDHDEQVVDCLPKTSAVTK